MIETLEDWNARLTACGCCPMPECPVPILQFQSITAKYSGGAKVLVSGVNYLEETREYFWYEDGGSGPFHNGENYSWSVRGWSLNPGPCGEQDIETITKTGPPADALITASYPVSHSNAFSNSDYYTIIVADFAQFTFAALGCAAGSLQSALYSLVLDPPAVPKSDFRRIRFRFQIPITHLGTYFKITYDVAEFPTVGDPSFFSEDNVVEWTGPGTGLESDPSWLTPWAEIEPPTTPGERRVVNVRFICYHGAKFGVKPQVTGEALELPAP